MIIIDGSLMEGGGQMLRTALALSALTGRPFQAVNIRRNRPRPGLKAQHICGIQALDQLSGVRTSCARPGAEALAFFPGKITPQPLCLDIGTAGSISLLLQCLLIPCMFADDAILLQITGGTDVRWSMPMDYVSHIVLPHFEALADIELKVLCRGFYPRGQGKVEIKIQPRIRKSDFAAFEGFINHLRTRIPPVDLASPAIVDRICGISVATENLRQADVAARQAVGAHQALERFFSVHIQESYVQSASTGTVITLWAAGGRGFPGIGADALGEKGVRAEAVGQSAARKLSERLASKAAVDEHLADNLIPLMALLGGTIRISGLTEHIRANIHVCEKFMDTRFQFDENQKIITVS
jgi:RNA 3'-terminal phosphate cyclase (ATP)